MEIKLESKDLKYLNDLNNAAMESEQNISALEIEKFRILRLYDEIKNKFSEFSKQIRVKYEVEHPDALIDLARGVIEIPNDDDEAIELGEMDDLPAPPPPPPKRIIAEDVMVRKSRKKNS